MKTVIFWKTKNQEEKRKVKEVLRITCESVNGESDFNRNVEELREYEQKGIIEIRRKP